MLKKHFFKNVVFTILNAIALQSFAQDYSAIYPTFKNYNITQSSSKNTVLLTTYSYQQTTNYTCGPAVIMSLLHYYGMLNMMQMNHQTEMQIANEMESNSQNGTSQDSMVKWLENHGFKVNYGEDVSTDTLINNIKHGIPTIIVWNDWNGHAVLVVGYQTESDSSNDMLFLADPETTSSITENQTSISGINTLSANDLQLNWFNAKYYFNPSHIKTGMYIVAVPRNK